MTTDPTARSVAALSAGRPCQGRRREWGAAKKRSTPGPPTRVRGWCLKTSKMLFFFFTGAASEDVALWCMLQTGGVFCKQWLYKHGLLWVFFHTRQVGDGKGTAGGIAEQPVFMGCFLSFAVPVPAGLIHMVGWGGVIHISAPCISAILILIHTAM